MNNIGKKSSQAREILPGFFFEIKTLPDESPETKGNQHLAIDVRPQSRPKPCKWKTLHKKRGEGSTHVGWLCV
jgi:hypothetical protein